MTLSSPPIAQNRPASVMSIAISVRGQEADVAAQQPEPAVDVADEGGHELVDDVEVVHGLSCKNGVLRGAPGGARPAATAMVWAPAAAGSGQPSGGVGRPEPRNFLVAAARASACAGRDWPASIASARYCAAIRFWIWNCCLAAQRQQLVGCLRACSAPSAPGFWRQCC
jgi:hypothetical protein